MNGKILTNTNGVSWADYFQLFEVTFGQEVVIDMEYERDNLSGANQCTISMSYEDFGKLLDTLKSKYGRTKKKLDLLD